MVGEGRLESEVEEERVEGLKTRVLVGGGEEEEEWLREELLIFERKLVS